MSLSERQKQFEAAVKALPVTLPKARIASNFGFSNSARVIEGGLFAGTSNLEGYSQKLAEGKEEGLEQFILLCVLTFPPQDEVYFAVVVDGDLARLNSGLLKLFHEGVSRNEERAAQGKSTGRISNNVKFYITRAGELFFHNYDFQASLDITASDSDTCCGIDSVWFSIWPPAASARRGMLAREFVGYLGRLIGHEKIHEFQVWPDEAAVNPAMQRMPASIPLAGIEAAVEALGGFYPGGEVRRYHAGLNFLNRKHFVILSGLSGTGKTQLAHKYALAVHGISNVDMRDPFALICPVRPEWTDPTGLTGYYDVLSNRYVVPPFLEAVLLATAHKETPVFVVLDEMNLARVEYYFSEVLSCIETGEPLQLHSNGVPLEGSTGTSIQAELRLPSNLFITGTINIDETTNPVSDKVLDRAVVIDMSPVQLDGFLSSLETREPELKTARSACGDLLMTVHDLMTAHGLGFGYRVAEEVVRYHAFVQGRLGVHSEEAMDELLVQKVLVKLRGSERQRDLLLGLRTAVEGLPASMQTVQRLIDDLDEYGSFQAAR